MLDNVLKIGRGEPTAENTELVQLLTDWGITANKDLVLDLSGIGNMFGAGPEIPIILQYEPSPITRPLARVPTAFPVPRSLDVKSGGKSTVEKLFGTTEDSIAVTEVGGQRRDRPQEGQEGSVHARRLRYGAGFAGGPLRRGGHLAVGGKSRDGFAHARQSRSVHEHDQLAERGRGPDQHPSQVHRGPSAHAHARRSSTWCSG